MIQVNDSYGKLSRSDIKALESDLSIDFPPEYVEFLQEYNGGRPFPDGVKVNGDHFDFIGHLYAIRKELAHDDLARNIEEYKDMILGHYLPFGESPGGDVYCLSLKPEEFGFVYHWDHEEAIYEGEPWEYNMTQLATSFNQFLAELYEC